MEVPEPDLLPENQGAGELDVWEHTFMLDWDGLGYSDKGMFADAVVIEYLTDVIKFDDDMIGSDCEWGNLAALRAEVPEGPKERRAPKNHDEVVVVPDDEIDPWVGHPYLWDMVEEETDPFKAKKAPSNSSASSVDSSESDTFLDDVDAMEALWARRRDVAVFVDLPIDDKFTWTVRGGKWTKLHKGLAFDCYLGYGRAGVPSAFCKAFGLRRSFSLSIRAYGEAPCISMVKAWCHRMAFLFDRWVHGGGTDQFVFTHEDYAAYREPGEFYALAGTANRIEVKAFAKIRTIRPLRHKGCK